MPVIPYVKNPTWADGSGGGTSIDAADLNKIEAGVFEAHQMPAVRVFHNAAQSLTTATLTAVAFNSERFDQAGGAASTQHDTVTNNSRLTCLFAGIYQITGTIEWSGNPITSILGIRKNGTTLIARNIIVANVQDMQVTCIEALAVNDYVELVAQQNSGGALNIATVGNISPEFMMVRVA